MNRRTLFTLVIVVVALISAWHRGHADYGVIRISTAGTLTIISPTEYLYVIEAYNDNSHAVSVVVSRSMKAPVGLTVVAWDVSQGLQPMVIENAVTHVNWALRTEMAPQQRGVITLRLRTAIPMVAPQLVTVPGRANGLPEKSWEFYLTDGK